MSDSVAIASILLALLIGAISPGPSFVLVVRNAIGLSRRDGIATALGMGLGGILFSGVALAGLYSLLTAVSWLYVTLKIIGGAYLVFLATKIWRSASAPLVIDNLARTASRGLRHSFWIGVATQLSNPKTAIVYGSIFASLLPQHPPLWCYLVMPPLVFIVESGWYMVVALCFSSKAPRDLYLRSKKTLDRFAAGIIAALGVHLVFSTYGMKS
ncbi:LysE family translocator [Herbaspirillum rhizosphaerae]|uniref:LysE family translocator n=1 Tax=Herbaspirillum rhizosphaerae TaxID=346179 RepID=UPI00067CD03C|nr:LysE family transporter [Herbaspirillum rhizosphaerae]